MTTTVYEIFKSGSTTYFYSSIFFPQKVRGWVFQLYGFVRWVDDLVDAVPQKVEEFHSFCAAYQRAKQGKNDKGWAVTVIPERANHVITEFLKLDNQMQFPQCWTTAFLLAMEADIYITRYHSMRQLQAYMFGSAEVIGLYMARLVGVPAIAYPSARMLGRAMQYINFLRDVAEDESLGRQYIPQEVVERYGLSSVSLAQAHANPQAWASLMAHQVLQYKQWQFVAQQGFVAIPTRYLIPIQSASDMYLWTANQIMAQPMSVWERKIKPSKWRVIATVCYNSVMVPLERLFC